MTYSASTELGGGTCGFLKHREESVMPLILFLQSFQLGCHTSCSFGSSSDWCLFRWSISASQVAKENYSQHTMLHLATLVRNFLTSMKIQFMPILNTPMLVNICSANISLLAKNFLPAVGGGSITQAMWGNAVVPVPLQSVHVENVASIAESLNCSCPGF